MKKSSFTLIEMLVYIAVLGILMVVLSSFLIWVNDSNVKAKVMRETLEDASRTMEFMVREIKDASSVYTPTTSSNQLSLETTKYLPTGERIAYIDFFLCGFEVCFKKEGQVPVALTKDKIEVNSLTFTEVISGDVPSVQIALSAKYKNPKNKPEYQSIVNLTSTASLRAY
jgi:type II secretory pathway pseudopilin PulG